MWVARATCRIVDEAGTLQGCDFALSGLRAQVLLGRDHRAGVKADIKDSGGGVMEEALAVENVAYCDRDLVPHL